MYSESLIQSLLEKAKQVRRNTILCIGTGTAGHIGGSCSSADLVTALYFYKMKYNAKNPGDEDRDRFLLSKGHVAILQYAAMAEAGYFAREELKTVKEIGSRLQGHPDYLKTPGIEAGTGSLGQGLSIGLGMALGMRMNGSDRRVYVLMGDGEQGEGQIWEAAAAAAAYRADHLVGIIDCNGLQATGRLKDRLDLGDLKKKWEDFGWEVLEIDGHNLVEILSALDQADTVTGKPTVILAHTIKGKGISFAENVVSYHNGALTPELYEQAMKDLA